MTPRRFAREVRTWRDRLGLSEWDVAVQPAETSDLDLCGAKAGRVAGQLDVSRESMTATLRVAMQQGDSDLHRVARHEMLHLCLADFCGPAFGLAEQMGPGGRAFAEAQLKDAAERTVLRLDRAFEAIMEPPEKTGIRVEEDADGA